jgi:dihydropteroate synthase
VTTRAETFFATLARARARRGVALMGICNVTPDSFSDGGRYIEREDAFAHVDALVAQGADVIDVGGESTRPGAAPVPPAEQLRRVLEVVAYAAERAVVSVDTTSADVARACLDAGAACVNDVSCARDRDLASAAAAHSAAYVLMHARRTQADMRGFGGVAETEYDNVVFEVLRDWRAAADVVRGAGVPREHLVMDPGLGFFKTARHSMDLLRRTRELVRGAGVPVLVGASNKSFLTVVDGRARPEERVGASIAAAVFAAREGAAVVRVHDVRATRQALDMAVVLGTPPGHAGGA